MIKTVLGYCTLSYEYCKKYLKVLKNNIKYWTFRKIYVILTVLNQQDFDMEIHSLNSELPYGSNCYILLSDNEAAVIDPSVNFEAVQHILPPEIKVKYILLTHSHFDHFLCIDSWIKNTDAEVCIGKYDSPGLKDSHFNCYKIFLGYEKVFDGAVFELSEGDLLRFGSDTIKVLDTPGHTKGSVTYITNGSAFVGDTVFAGFGVGRCDLPGGNYYALEKSIDKILNLPVNTEIYSGHGPATSVSSLKTQRR